jgi:hypothetical protein
VKKNNGWLEIEAGCKENLKETTERLFFEGII